ncbi:O-antigen ligase family protein [Arthrobacter rhombi]|uniref:O-antigen ligase family protein n=1 Tax=Arthrobacter rhombi TaxID=71253 RepID=UPI003FCFA226
MLAPDAVTVLTVYILLLLCIPSDRKIDALGGAGSPATIFALISLLWWCWDRIQRPRPRLQGTNQPLRAASMLFLGAVFVSYGVSSTMAMPVTEGSVADMGVLRVVAFTGILLVANDGIPSHARLLTLLRRCCLLAGVYASLGIAQFATGMSFVDRIPMPGLSQSASDGIDIRAGFVRPEATAMHPLEYAVVLTMLLPLCLTFAIHDKQRSSLIRWFPVAAIATSAALSVTRSALVGMVVVVLILFPTWPAAVRAKLGACLVIGAAVVYVAVPGMAGTILGLFSGGDTSVSSRTDSYGTAMSFLEISPWFGRGYGTFLPSYRILDNQYLSLAIEIGVVGLAAVLIVIVMSMVLALVAARRYTDKLSRSLGVAFFAAMAGGALLTAFFDSFAFSQAGSLLFFIAGLCGAYWNTTPPSEIIKTPKTSCLRGNGDT